MDKNKQNRNFGYSLHFSEYERQCLRVLANDDKISMAEEIKLLIKAETNRRVEKIRREHFYERGY